jgi:hypothetical protein
MTKRRSDKKELELRVRILELHVEALYKVIETHATYEFQHRYQDPGFPRPDSLKGWVVT